MRVLVFGYSESPERYSNMAARLLTDYHHEVITVNPRHEDELLRLNTKVDTLTLYVNPQVSDKFQELLLRLKPKRVIFNPNTENSALQMKFQAQGAEVVVGCTLVMLKTDQFDH